MPPEPKKPIEELLEASARARRAEFGADPKMPNPMRAQLHEEIARVNRSEKPELPRRSWLVSFWPQLSLASAVAAALVVASVVWFRNETKFTRGNMELAMQPATAPAVVSAREDAAAPLRSLDAVSADQLANARETESAAAAESSAVAGNVADARRVDAFAAAAKDTLAKTDEPKLAEAFRDEAKIAAAPARARPAGSVAKEKSEILTMEAPAAAKPAATPAMAARSFVQTRKMETANLRQRYSQNAVAQSAAPNEKSKSSRANLLNTFDVQQEGDRIRVVDEDGSTYTGRLEQIAQSDSRSLANKKEQNFAGRSPAKMKRGEEVEPNEYYFRAAGFNSTLKKKVVLEANYIETPSENEQRAKKDRAQEQQQNLARIVGTAKVAGEPPVEVDAVSVER